jgi:hypothetical protein
VLLDEDSALVARLQAVDPAPDGGILANWLIGHANAFLLDLNRFDLSSPISSWQTLLALSSSRDGEGKSVLSPRAFAIKRLS